MKQGTLDEFDRCIIHGFGGLINILAQRLALYPMNEERLIRLQAECNRLETAITLETPRISAEVEVSVDILDWWAESGLKGILDIIEARIKKGRADFKTPIALEEQVIRLKEMLEFQRRVYGN